MAITSADVLVSAAVHATKQRWNEDLPDYRQKSKVTHPLDEVLLLMLAAALAGGVPSGACTSVVT